jgi:accessory colonization factor AcfC
MKNMHPLIFIAVVLILLKLAGILVYGPEGPKSSLHVNPHAYDDVVQNCTTFDPDTGENDKIDSDCVERAFR